MFDRYLTKDRVLLLGHDLELVKVLRRDDLLEAEGRSWPHHDVEPRRFGRHRVWLAHGVKILPWPTATAPLDDLDGVKVEITPEYLDRLVRTYDVEAWARGSQGITLMERLLHVGAGAALGMVLFAGLLKLLGVFGSRPA
ncbi:MAG TPA: hypothetical protein VI997_11570 [Candidatus Thermoplasmatota archaeon]|nr:hypothetical protein [Candidatus Thermoplasmatota archaeon]